MNQEQIERFGEQLRDARDSLLSQIAMQREGMGARAEVAAAHFSHPEDSHAQMISQKDIEFAVGEQDTAELEAVEAALGRIASHTYGQCIDCGEAIALARSQVSPEVARCLNCQVVFERLQSTHE
jgi:DnaK suppressor protein